MILEDLKKTKLPDDPGVYFFRDRKRHILYVGKATSLRDRVKSYFANDLMHTRGKHIVDMVTIAKTVTWVMTDSALEALILEASFIKKYQPFYNSREKDDKSYNYVVITEEEYPRVLTIRERTMLTGTPPQYRRVFGPFPEGGSLQEALRILRRILPFHDSCQPGQGTPCFDRQIGLCPGVCTGEISKEEYARRIRHIMLFFQGKKSQVQRGLEREMHAHAKRLEFETAGEYKRMISALRHIKDVSLIDTEIKEASKRASRTRRAAFRIEAYDIAHISGTDIVGVMTVVEDGEARPNEYRKFNLHENARANDPLHLSEVLLRRLEHPEWRLPGLIVVDGGVAQRNRILKVLHDRSVAIPVVSVVKDPRHKPKDILGDRELTGPWKKDILLANAESHRFAVGYHRKRREIRGRARLPKDSRV